MYNHQVVFYLLTLFVIFGGGILDTRYLNVSNICLNLALLAPLFILKAKVEGLSYYLNKKYELDELKYVLKNNANLSDSEIRKYIRKIDIINDIDEDGIDIAVDQLTNFAKESYSVKELKMILKRIDKDNMKNTFRLFDLDINSDKIEEIIQRTIVNLKT